MSQRYVAVFKDGHRCAGQYLKAGGNATTELQEAQVIGWVSAKKGYRGYAWSRDFTLIPVTIVINKEASQ